MHRSRGGVIETDRELIDRLIHDGSRQAFEQLYERHTPRLLRFVSRVNGRSDFSVVEDVVQETWLRGVSGLRRFDWRSSFSTWLRGIALNVSRERLRSERTALHVDLTPDSIDRIEDGYGGRDHEGKVDLERALRALPEGQRMVLVLHDLEGFTHVEVARMLGISAGTSKSQLHDARKRLEGLLTKGL